MDCFSLTCCLPGNAANARAQMAALDYSDVATGGSAVEEELFVAGTTAQDEGDWEKAVGLFKTLSAKYPKNANYMYHLAYCLQEIAPLVSGDGEKDYHAQAKDIYERVLAIDSNHHEAWYNLGYVQEELKMFKDAVVSFARALELDPTDKDALINLGNCYMSLNDFERSVQTYVAAIKLDPNCVMSHYNLASAHHSAATSTTDPAAAHLHFQNARAKFEAAIELNADYADAYFNLGICYQDEGDSRNARKMYLKAIELQPDMEEAADAIEALDRLSDDQH
mmetsp:Transcript_47559/g.95812  ORF Transcript_47559/g.95812 Transcript_47559/m.95812 type:complete len:280 (-) Transcript_47559:177-1016(-)